MSQLNYQCRLRPPLERELCVQAIVYVIDDKFKERLQLLLLLESRKSSKLQVFAFVFNLLNGTSLSEKAISKVKVKFIDGNVREANIGTIQFLKQWQN